MMKPTILFSCLLFCLGSQAQFGKKTLRAIEKQAGHLPADTLIISQMSVEVGAQRDSLFGKTTVNGLPGWGRYFVNLEGAFAPTAPVSGKYLDDEVAPFIQVGIYKIAMSSNEVSNKEYREFVNWTREHRPDQVQAVLIDTMGWMRFSLMSAPMMNYYHHHPAFDDYPLTNVSHQQAKLYLEWLTQQYNSSPKRKYKKVVFRLPTEAEWMYAYIGEESDYMATYRGYFRKENGQLTANFILYPPVSQLKLQDSTFLEATDSTLNLGWVSNHHTTSKLDTISYTLHHKSRVLTLVYLNDAFSGTMYTTPVKSYWPNSVGIYNMAGNVAEFVAEEGIVKGGHWNTTGFYLKPTSRETFLDQPSASPTRGFRWVMEVIEE